MFGYKKIILVISVIFIVGCSDSHYESEAVLQAEIKLNAIKEKNRIANERDQEKIRLLKEELKRLKE